MKHRNLPSIACVLACSAFLSCCSGSVSTPPSGMSHDVPINSESRALREDEFAKLAKEHIRDKYGVDAEISEVGLPYDSIDSSRYGYVAKGTLKLEGESISFTISYDDNRGWMDSFVAAAWTPEIEREMLASAGEQLAKLGEKSAKVDCTVRMQDEAGDDIGKGATMSDAVELVSAITTVYLHRNSLNTVEAQGIAEEVSHALALSDLPNEVHLYVLVHHWSGLGGRALDDDLRKQGIEDSLEIVDYDIRLQVDADNELEYEPIVWERKL